MIEQPVIAVLPFVGSVLFVKKTLCSHRRFTLGLLPSLRIWDEASHSLQRGVQHTRRSFADLSSTGCVVSRRTSIGGTGYFKRATRIKGQQGLTGASSRPATKSSAGRLMPERLAQSKR